MPKANPKQLNELRELADWFRVYFGDGWEFKLEFYARLYRQQISRILRKHDNCPAGFVDRMRTARAQLLSRATSQPEAAGQGPRSRA